MVMGIWSFRFVVGNRLFCVIIDIWLYLYSDRKVKVFIFKIIFISRYYKRVRDGRLYGLIFFYGIFKKIYIKLSK